MTLSKLIITRNHAARSSFSVICINSEHVTTCKNMVAGTSDYHVEICKMYQVLSKGKQKYFNATLKSSQAKQFALYADSEETKKNSNKKLNCSKKLCSKKLQYHVKETHSSW